MGFRLSLSEGWQICGWPEDLAFVCFPQSRPADLAAGQKDPVVPSLAMVAEGM